MKNGFLCARITVQAAVIGAAKSAAKPNILFIVTVHAPEG